MMTTSLANVAVIGSGTMGAGIAEVAAAAGRPVRIFDINPKAVGRRLRASPGVWRRALRAANWPQSRPTRCWRGCIRPTI